MFELLIAAAVPLVCRIEASLLTCNSPAGYDLLARDADGTTRLVESSDGPARKPLAHPLRPGETLVLIARVRP